MPPKSTAKSKKSSAPPAHPKYADMIKDAIVSLKDRRGSSRQAIKKYILNTYKLPDNPTTNSRLRMAITKGCEKGIFSFPNGPSGTLKLVKKEKDKKEVEKKEKPAPKKTERSAPKAKTPEKKTTTKKAPPAKKVIEKTTRKAPKVRKTATKETTSRRAKATTPSTSKRAAANKKKST